MASKLSVPRPSPKGKVQPKEKEKPKEKEVVLEATELEADNTEPSTTPPVEEEALIVESTPIPTPSPTPTPTLSLTPTPTPAPILPGILIGPTPTPSSPPPTPSAREVAFSLPSQYELDSERKSSPPVAQRRKELTKYVASAVGVAWFICTCAIGETALRSFIASMH